MTIEETQRITYYIMGYMRSIKNKLATTKDRFRKSYWQGQLEMCLELIEIIKTMAGV